MEKLDVKTYLYLLKNKYQKILADYCITQIGQQESKQHVRSEFEYVVKCMTNLANHNQDPDRFEIAYLQRVISKFRSDVEVQTLELKLLEVILLHALNEHQIESVKVPAIIELNRDKPFIRPDAMVRINAAAHRLDLKN